MPVAAPIPRASLTRDDLVRLGQANAPWEFLPVAMQALRQVPDDFGLRLITVSNLVRLGLKTAAADHLALLPEAITTAPEVQGLVRIVAEMPSDIIEPEARIATCRGNLDALGPRNPIQEQDFVRWAAAAAKTTYCRSTDGNILCRPSATPIAASPDRPDTRSADTWRSFADHRPSLARMVKDHFSPASPEFGRPVYLEGIDPPWLLMLLAQARPRDGTGYIAPIAIVQTDPEQFLDGLSQADLRPILNAGNITAFVGPRAAQNLADYLRTREDFQLAGPSLTAVATRTRLSPPLSELLAEASAHQEARNAELLRQAAAAYPPRSPESWRRRFDRALSGADAPLRILIPTTRFSTFLQHASRDLARTIESRGHKARILIEPDDSTKFVTPAYLAATLDFRPDLVITINYPRATLGDAIPEHLPLVCWVQDAMPHLFSPTIGAAQGPLDFVVGHLFDELFDRHNYPRARAMPAAIVADESKFHTGAVHNAARFQCEIAYVSHQSETPEAQHQRLRAEFSKLSLAGAVDRARPLVEREARKPLSDLQTTDLRDAAIVALRDELRREPDARTVDIVTRSYCQPHLDRLLRHQTLEWASDIAARRGWRMKLYGKGWESHPRLGSHAAGPLDHGDDLRSSYQTATVHLHMMAHALVHQRLIECILSGGFPLCRLHAPERWAITETLTRQGVREGAQPIDMNDPNLPPRRRVVSWADAPSLMRLASSLQRLGIFDDIIAPTQGAQRGPMIDESEWLNPAALKPHEPDFWSAFGLLGQSEHFMFHSPESLEARIDFALSRPDQRALLSATARARFQSRFTYTAFTDRLLSFIRDNLGSTT